MDEKEIAYALGMVFANLVLKTEQEAEMIQPDKGSEKAHKYLLDAIFHGKITFLEKVLPCTVEEASLEAFYNGLTFIMVRTKIPFSEIMKISEHLPGKPGLREPLRVTSGAMKEGKIFRDKLAEINIEATNDVGKMAIKCIISQIRQLRQQREAENYLNNTRTPQHPQK